MEQPRHITVPCYLPDADWDVTLKVYVEPAERNCGIMRDVLSVEEVRYNGETYHPMDLTPADEEEAVLAGFDQNSSDLPPYSLGLPVNLFYSAFPPRGPERRAHALLSRPVINESLLPRHLRRQDVDDFSH